MKKILDKAEGPFLWTTPVPPVLSELLNAHSEEETNQTLEDVPRDMGPPYQKTLESVTFTNVRRKLTKAVLISATCAIRPLTAGEQKWPLKFDVRETNSKKEAWRYVAIW